MTSRFAPLGELCAKIGSGATPRGGNKNYKKTGIALVRSMNVHLGRFKPDELAFIDETQAAKLNNVALEPDDVLLNITGASVARSCMLDNSVLPARVNQHVCILRPHRELLSDRYLMRFLTSEKTQMRLLRIAGAGATREAITKGEIQKLQIPLPPLAEQKRIAGILDAADAMRAKRRESLAQLDTLLQSTFLTLFGDPVTNPKGWAIAPLETLIDSDRPITYGILKPGPDIEDGIPYVRVVDIKNEQVLVDQLRRTTAEIANQYKRSRLKPGDLLMSIRGHVGRMAITPHEADGANITQDTARLALAGAEASYVMQCITTQGMQHYMDRRTKGIAVRGINLGDVKKLPIPTPPLDLQRRFAAIVESVERQKARLRAHLAELDTLFASLQSRAFSGEL
ncbi:MAG: restriction endonuclease subunit S [Verrucomicrobiota bacterium]